MKYHLYETEEWLSSDHIDRAQLLLVIEGLKDGTTINWDNQNLLEKIKLEKGLAFQKVKNFNLYDVAKSQKLLDDWNKNLKANQKPFYDFLELHGLKVGMFLNDIKDKKIKEGLNQVSQKCELNSYRIRGVFYGYPKCCIDEYIIYKSNPDTLHKFNSQLEELLDKKEQYNPILKYTPPSFTPCDINCSEAISMLTGYKAALDRLDAKASNVYKVWN